ncbi:MAG: hypothetical protein ABIJ18_05195 [archaeon]
MPYSKQTKKKFIPLIINYIKRNNNATYRDIERDLNIKVSSIFDGGMKEAYELASIPLSRPLLKRNRKEQEQAVIDYIKKNPDCTVTEIFKETRVSIPRVFGSIVTAYDRAGVGYKRKDYTKKINKKKIKKSINEKTDEVILLIKKNPFITVIELNKKLDFRIHDHFKNMESLYRKAGIKYIKGNEKRTSKIKNKIIEYIKSNPNSTQW